MSTQRRRVLENSGLIIPADGVYIEGLDGRAYTVDNWKGGNAANSIVVASGDVKFRVALTEPLKSMRMSGSFTDTLENYMTALSDLSKALADYDGAGNTAKIMQVQPSTDYAAGYCNAFIFPDGKTKGFLPSLGQLNLVNQNVSDVNAALSKCGGTAMNEYAHWASTFWGLKGVYRKFYVMKLDGFDSISIFNLVDHNYVRPFGDIS